MDKNKFREIVQYAVGKEAEAIDFYNRAIKVTRFPGVKKMFLEIAEEEGEHRKLLAESIAEEIEERRLESIPDLKIDDYLVEIGSQPIMSYANILKASIKMEEQFFRLYHDLNEVIADQSLKDLFTRLAQEEGKHKSRFDEEIFGK